MGRAHQAYRWLIPTAILAVVAAFLLPGLGRPVMNREQELRVALTARTMADGGSWLRPEFLGEPRLRKPPLMYWAVATSYLATGTAHSATVARLPSALAGLALVGAMYALAAPYMGRRRSALMALVCGSSFLFIKQGRVAETDMLLTLGSTVSALLLHRGLVRSRPGGSWWRAGLASGMGFLAKGPAALALPVLAAVLFRLTPPRPHGRASPGRLLGFLLVFLAIAAPWYLVILGDPAGAAQVRDELQRAAATSEHPGPVIYYLYTLFHALAPWSLALPGALWWGWRHRRRSLTRFALVWLGSSLVVLSALESKQLHYALLLIPPASLLIGDWLGSALVGRGPARLTAHRMLLVLAGVALACGLALLGVTAWGSMDLPFKPMLLTGLYATLAGLAALWLRRNPVLNLALFTCAWLALSWCAAIRIMPALAEERVIEEAVMLARTPIQEAPHVIYAGPRNAIAEFYADRRLEVIPDPVRAWRKARPGDLVIVVGKPAAWPYPVEPITVKSHDELACAILSKPR